MPATNEKLPALESLRLAEDIAALRLCMTLLASIDEFNIMEPQNGAGYRAIREVLTTLREWIRHAEGRLRVFLR